MSAQQPPDQTIVRWCNGCQQHTDARDTQCQTYEAFYQNCSFDEHQETDARFISDWLQWAKEQGAYAPNHA